MTQTKYVVGDKVVTYSYCFGRAIGTVINTTDVIDNCIDVKLDNYIDTLMIHTKACRRLKKKVVKYYYIEIDTLGRPIRVYENPCTTLCIKVKECK